MFTRGSYPKKLLAHESMKSPLPASAHWSLRPKPTSGAEGVSPGDIPSRNGLVLVGKSGPRKLSGISYETCGFPVKMKPPTIDIWRNGSVTL